MPAETPCRAAPWMPWLALIGSLAWGGGAGADSLEAPEAQRVTLEPHTRITVPVVPDLGTRFLFPFYLDEVVGDASFAVQLTNQDIFACDICDAQGRVTRQALRGRNSFVVTAPVRQGVDFSRQYAGHLFVSLGRYNLTVFLQTTTKLSEHRSDVVFELDPEAAENLVAEAVERRVAAAEARVEAQAASIEDEAQARAFRMIGELALADPETRRIKERRRFTAPSGAAFALYLDQVQTRGGFHLFLFELENDSGTPLPIVAAGLTREAGESLPPAPLVTAANLPPPVAPGGSARGVVVTRDPVALSAPVSLSVLIDGETYEVPWD